MESLLEQGVILLEEGFVCPHVQTHTGSECKHGVWGWFFVGFFSLGHLVLGEQLTIVLLGSLNLGRRNPK